MKQNKIELLAPAKSIEAMLVAYKAGANAVYAGGQKFSARAYATNFCEDEIIEAIHISHLFGKKFYLAVNTVLKEEEIEEELYDYIYPLYKAGLDAVIVQDMGVFKFIRDNFVDLDIHISTQATLTNINGAKFFKDNGADRVVISREVELSTIKKIRDNVDIEIEAFVHGALCYCYSGQCFFSSMLGDRSANRGRCAQPCRLPYDVVDDSNGKTINKEKIHPISLKDMCTINNIEDFIKSGVTSFKIEGRMKSLEYVAGVTHIYRKYIDEYESTGTVNVSHEDYQMLQDLYNRGGFTKGYIHGTLKNMLTMNGSKRIDSGNNAKKRYEDLCNDINKNIIDSELKKDIDFDVYITEGEKSLIIARTDDKEISVYGEEVSKAINSPVSEDDITKCITALGNTYFRKREINIYVSENAFISVGALKKLRRKVIDEMLLAYTDKREDELQGNRIILEESKIGNSLIEVSVQNLEQFNEVNSINIVDRIFLDMATFTYEEALSILELGTDKEIYIAYPNIFENKQLEWCFSDSSISGFLVKNYEIWYHLRDNYPNKKLILNYNIHTHNSYSNEFAYENGVDETFIPIEINLSEIRKVRSLGSNLYIYGYVPLMITKQDLYKNLKINEPFSLKDRYNIKFNVKRTNSNYNIIYNSVALSLIDKYKDIGDNMNLFFDFTKEKVEDIRSILNYFNGYGDSPYKNFTRGHFKRGIK